MCAVSSRAQLLHVVMTRPLDAIHHRSTEVGASLGEQVDPSSDGLLLLHGETVPPLGELIGDLHLPHHDSMSLPS